MLISLLAALAVVIADLVSKAWIAWAIPLYESIPFIKGIFNITNVPNDGIAFGMLDNARWLFMLATGIIVVVLLAISVFAKGYHKMVYFSLGLVLGGGLGNFIDRIVKLGRFDESKCVVDFIDFCAFPELWKWTFNVADIGVCVGVALFVMYVVFLDKKAYNSGLKAVLYEDKDKKNGGSKEDE